MASQLVVDGEQPVAAWKSVLRTVLRNGESHGGIREVLHLTVVAKRARPLVLREIREYRRLVGPEPWERATKIYTVGAKVAWKPSYIGRLTGWPGDRGPIDQLAEIRKKALRTPGSKTMCASVFHPRDLKRYIVASVPCVLSLDFKIRRNEVLMAAFFRSQDVYRLFLGDLHYLALIRRELTEALRGTSKSRNGSLEDGDLTLHLCSAHVQSNVRKKLEAFCQE